MNLIDDLPTLVSKREINVVIEIPLGGLNKFEYQPERGFFLDRVLYSAVYYPFEYGFVPRTKAADGDTVDVMLLASHPTFPGCIVRAKPIGLLRMVDEKGEDNKVLAVPSEQVNPRFRGINDIKDIAKHLKREYGQFMLDYKRLEEKKTVKLRGWAGGTEAMREIKKAMKNYEKGI